MYLDKMELHKLGLLITQSVSIYYSRGRKHVLQLRVAWENKLKSIQLKCILFVRFFIIIIIIVVLTWKIIVILK